MVKDARSRQHTGMNMNPDSEARRESARQTDGKFGPQEYAEPAGGTEALDTQAPRTEPVAETRQIVLDALFDAGHPAEADVSHDMYDNTVIVIGSNRMVIGDEYTDGVRDGWSWSQYAAEPDSPKGWEAMSDGDGTTDEAEVRRAVASFVNGSLDEARGYRPAEAVDAFVPANYPPMQSADEHARLQAAVKAEDAVGGPEKMTAAKDALWHTVLRSGYDVDADQPLDWTHTTEDLAPESKAAVEADFESWVSENEDAVKAFTETVSDPDGGDPAEFLARNWWLTKNGHGTEFTDLLSAEPEYARAVAEQFGAVKDDEFRARAGIVGAEADLQAARERTPLDILKEKAAAYQQAVLGGHSEYAEISKEYQKAVRRAEALTALDKATPVREYEVYVEDGTVYIA